MTTDNLVRFTQPLILMQFAAFAWGVNRELQIGEVHKRPLIPMPDVLNITSMFTTIACLIVLPIATGSYLWVCRMVLGGAYVLIAFHPVTVALRYRLWSKGRGNDIGAGVGQPYATRAEYLCSFLSLALAILVAVHIRGIAR